jgi:integrase/recombinase XerD
MGLKLFKRGKTYYVRGTVRGQSVFETTGTGNRAVAETIRIKTENRLLDHSIYGRVATLMFESAANNYEAAGGSMRYISEELKNGKPTGILHYFRGKVLATITQTDLEAAARALYPKASPETVNRQLFTPFIAVWNHAFASEPDMARKWRRPRAPKGTNVARLKPERAGTKPVAYGQAAAFIAAMSPAPAMLTAFLFYTGMRPIEAFALEAGDINVAGRWIVIRNSKTGEPRGVPMHEFLAGWLPDLVERGGRLFRTHKGKPYDTDDGGGLKTAINGARRRSSIKGISPYTARHSVSTQLVINGVHAHIKDQILGHAADSMSRVYTHVPQKPLIEAINTLPVPAALLALPWVASPKDCWSRLVEGTGKRSDLAAKRFLGE